MPGLTNQEFDKLIDQLFELDKQHPFLGQTIEPREIHSAFDPHEPRNSKGEWESKLSSTERRAAQTGTLPSAPKSTPAAEATKTAFERHGFQVAKSLGGGKYVLSHPTAGDEVRVNRDGSWEHPASGHIGNDHVDVASGMAVSRARVSGDWYRNKQADALESYLKGEPPLAEHSDGKYRTVIMPSSGVQPGHEYDPAHKGIELVFKHGDGTPIPTGKWMDWPEPGWGLSDKQYRSMPAKERAQLEAKEQVEKWLPTEYEKERNDWLNHSDDPRLLSRNVKAAFRSRSKRLRK